MRRIARLGVLNDGSISHSSLIQRVRFEKLTLSVLYSMISVIGPDFKCYPHLGTGAISHAPYRPTGKEGIDWIGRTILVGVSVASRYTILPGGTIGVARLQDGMCGSFGARPAIPVRNG